MKFAEKLKALRKQFKLSQEQLAEKLGVSRQAITKWETDAGLPDIENLMAIATLFSVSIDDLLSNEKLARSRTGYVYESVTEYDIRRPCHFDVRAAFAMEVSITTSDDEKLRVRLASNVIQTLEKDYKVRIDEHRNRMDIDIRRLEKAADITGKDALYIFISLPAVLCEKVELATSTKTLRLIETDFPFELDGKAGNVFLERVTGNVALNCNIDMEIQADSLPPALELNQINASSVLHIPQGLAFRTKAKGINSRTVVIEDGKPFPYQSNAEADSYVEIAGMNAELVIDHGI